MNTNFRTASLIVTVLWVAAGAAGCASYPYPTGSPVLQDFAQGIREGIDAAVAVSGFAEGEVDRCPTGTGVSGRLAIHHARGEIGLEQPITIESIIGSRFSGQVVSTTTFGPHAAIIPEVEGAAYITGQHQFLIDPDDPLRTGFILR